MIVRLHSDGAVVADADDCSAVHVETGLDADGLHTALVATGTGVPAEPSDRDTDDRGTDDRGTDDRGTDDRGTDDVVLDIAVLRSRAQLLATAPGWAECFDGMVAGAGERLTDDGLGLRVPVERTPGD